MPLVRTSSIPTPPSPQLQVALDWVDAMSDGDFDRLRDGIIISNNAAYSHILLPKSLGRPAMEGLENVEKLFDQIMPPFKEHNVTVHEFVDTPRKIVLYASSDGYLKSGYRYQNEYMIILDIADDPTESGPYKVSRALEFVGETATLGLRGALAKEKAKEAA